MRGAVARAVLATLIALLALGAVQAGGSSRTPAPGMIVFASDRDKADPGEIYSLAPGTAPRDVSRSLASDHGLAVAPAGDLIAFWSDRSGADRLYLARSDGSHLRRVDDVGTVRSNVSPGAGPLSFSADGSRLFAGVEGLGFVVNTLRAVARPFRPCAAPRPSPDGRLVACGGRGHTVVYDLAGRARFGFPGERPIWSSRGSVTNQPSAGSSQQRASAPVYEESGRMLARVQGQPIGWSPDGRSLVFRRGDSLRVAGPGSLTRSRMLVPRWGAAGAVSFTPDSRFVSTANERGHALLVPLAGGAPGLGLDFGTGAWSSQGRLAYLGIPRRVPPPGFRAPVYVTDVRGRSPRVVGRYPYDYAAQSELRWLPGARRVLLVTSNSCGGKGLFTVPAAGGEAQPLNRDSQDLETPVWSADGTRIAYSAQPFACGPNPTLSSHLETVKANGFGRHQVTHEPAEQGDLDASFSPDGTSLVFLHVTASTGALETVATGSGRRAPLLPARTRYRRSPVWSPDGSRIAYVAGNSVLAVASSGGTPRALLRELPSTCGGGGLAWSPDGTRLAIGGKAGIYLLALAGPAKARLAIRVPCADNPSFSPDGTQIAFDAPVTHPLGRQTAIMAARADGRGVRTLSTVPFRQSVHPSWQPLR